ncbi:MAG: antitermination protein NusG, partial [bacterium]|nr:antitermination protein NusG [bacterium]
PFFGSDLGAEAKSAMTRGLVPDALWWFRWGAMLTFVSGWMLVLMYIGMREMDLGTPLITKILTGGLMGTIMWANVWLVIWPAQQVVIKSAEQVAAGGDPIPTAAARAARAGLASRTNTMFSIPMLFFMGSARHLNGLHQGENDILYWIVALAAIGLLELNCLIGTDQSRQKYLGSVSGTIHTGVAATAVLYIIGAVLNS